MKLVEEIGELAELPDRRDGRKADDEGGTQTQLAYELADVIQ